MLQKTLPLLKLEMTTYEKETNTSIIDALNRKQKKVVTIYEFILYCHISSVRALASGGVVAGGIFAFISAIGIVPRMAKEQKLKIYSFL